ncbi:MAG: TolC family protein [Bacteroidetes bacterium]|nr:MAG: TolC family protein [Bacteroidota bacterium]
MHCPTLIFCLLFASNLLLCRGQQVREAIPCEWGQLSALTLEKSPLIQRQRLRLQRTAAELQGAAATFDYRMVADMSYVRDGQYLFQQDARFEVTDGRIRANSLHSSAGVRRTFRSGLSSGLTLDYSRMANNYPFNAFGESVSPYLADNFTTLGMWFRQPLLRGKGRKFATAGEQFYQKMLASDRWELNDVAARELYNMSLAYWEYLSSFRRLSIYKENEMRVRKVLEMTQELLNADRKTKNDLIQIQADLADKERQTLAAEQYLYQARLNLGRSMGLNEAESADIGLPLNPFPSLSEAHYDSGIELENLMELARNNRTDLRALLKVKEALQINFELAQNQMKPQLDLLASLSYGGTDVGNQFSRVLSPLSRLPGRNVQMSIGLNFQIPFKNYAARASLLNRQLAVADQQVAIDNQIRSISLNLSIALNALHTSVQRLQKARQTLQYYEEVFADEQVKFQNGLTTLLNLILFQERLTFSQLDYLQAQQDFAAAIVQLRMETGTLLPVEEGGTFSAHPEVFYQLPDWK